MRVMMHAQRTASRRNSACSQLSAFVGSNMLQGQPPPAVLAWLENPVLSHHVAHDIEALCFELRVPESWQSGDRILTSLVLPDGTRVAAKPPDITAPGESFTVSVPTAALRALGSTTVDVYEEEEREAVAAERAPEVGGGARPISAAALEAAAPALLPSEVPPSLLENGGAEASCAICKEALLADGETPIRQLPCSHAFHCNCCDPWFLKEHERSCPSCRAVLEVDDADDEELAPPRPSAYEEFLRLRESGVLAAMIRQHQEQEQERASARSALFEPRAGGQGGVIASML